MRSSMFKLLQAITAPVLILATLSGCILQTAEIPVPVTASISPAADAPIPAGTASPSAAVPELPALPEEAIRYLSNSGSEIIIDENGGYQSGLESIDTARYDVFFAGETHATKKDFDMELALLQYLHRTAGVRYILMEHGYATSAYLNRYLQSGDLSIPKKIMLGLSGTMSFSNEQFAFWQKICEYNLSLPPEERLTVIGIDLQHQLSTGLLYLRELVKKEPVPPEITGTIMSLRSTDMSLLDLIALLNADHETNGAAYKAYLGDDYFDFTMSLKGCLDMIKAQENNGQSFDTVREQAMYMTFLAAYEHFGIDKCFGQFGAEHVFQAYCDTAYFDEDSDRFAILLNQASSPVAGRVCTVFYSYEGSAMMLSDGQAADIYDDFPLPVSLRPEGGASGLTLFVLGATDSPFASAPLLVSAPSADSTLSYYQYIALIRNSGACTPYKHSSGK